MSIDPQVIADIVQLNGGRLVGKTRLQKTFYFLELFGLGADLDFQYHHYGPYSEDLSLGADDAVALGFVSLDWRVGNNSPYAVFSVDSQKSVSVDEKNETRKQLLSVLNKYDSVSLELAATADFLSKVGYSDDPWSETRIRKSTKATDARIDKAKNLLLELQGLS